LLLVLLVLLLLLVLAGVLCLPAGAFSSWRVRSAHEDQPSDTTLPQTAHREPLLFQPGDSYMFRQGVFGGPPDRHPPDSRTPHARGRGGSPVSMQQEEAATRDQATPTPSSTSTESRQRGRPEGLSLGDQGHNQSQHRSSRPALSRELPAHIISVYSGARHPNGASDQHSSNRPPQIPGPFTSETMSMPQSD
uniref:Uncharacterized protein n=1 Tax=Laticauda laticaudata TaxID=8630 RepID=A0A8C5WRT9_LATLA